MRQTQTISIIHTNNKTNKDKNQKSFRPYFAFKIGLKSLYPTVCIVVCHNPFKNSFSNQKP
jgi:hypothetical protein